MTQHALTIANQAGASFRADIVNALQALGSNSLGTTAPATTYAGQIWIDTGTSIDASGGPWIRKRNSANSAWTRISHSDVDLISEVVSQAYTAFTTAGTSTAYTLTPLPALTALAANQRYRVNFNQASGANPTLQVSGLAAVSIMQYNSSGTLINASVAANQLSDVEYNGTYWVILDPLPSLNTVIPTLTATVAANALTIGASAQTLSFRSATLGSGAVSTINAAPANLVVPSTATLGTVSAQMSRLVVIELLNAGVAELGVVNISGGNNLDETTLISTTAISAAATAANVIYSTTARSNVPFRVVGYIESTQVTAGTWVTAPSTIQGAGGQALAAMSSIGYGQTWQTVTRTTGTTYYNTTGRPILFAYASASAVGGDANFTVNGLVVYGAHGGTAGVGVGGTIIIPPGASYSFSNSTGQNTCCELR